MGNLWFKIKVWLKIAVLAALVIYVLTFVLMNHTQPVHVWVWYGTRLESSLLTALACTFVAGIIFTVLLRTIWKTWRQIAQMRDRGRSERLEREVAEMKSKASRLQTRPPAGESTIAPR